MTSHIEAIGVPPKKAAEMIGCGLTKLYEYIGSQELESYMVGRARRVTTESVRALVSRLVAEQKISA